GRPDELRREHHRRLSAIWRLHGAHSQRRETRRSSGAAADQIRDGHQPQDRESARRQNLRQSALARRRGDRMKRRAFILALGGAAAWPLEVGAQRGRMPRIGLLAPGRSVGADASLATLNSVVTGLRELGYVEGQTIAIERGFGEANADRLREVAA